MATDTPRERGDEGFWARLGRRRVVQGGAAYVAVAWALLQGLAYATSTFHWPERLQQVATVALLVGLPIALVLAWYHGDRGEQRVTRGESALIASLLLLGGGLLWWWGRPADVVGSVSAGRPTVTGSPASAIPDDKSIAVLPFVNMSSDPEQEYFSDGLSEELLDKLARLPELRVIGRTSSFQYKGRNEDLRVIGERLGVAHLLEGSVRRSATQVRITAQLIRATDGSHLWSKTYDRRLEDIFAVQREIAQEVARELRIVLASDAAAASRPVATGNLTAYDLYLQGRYLFNTRTFENIARGIELLQAATERDPKFAEAQATLAVAIMVARDYLLTGDSGGAIPVTRSEQAARRALALDPSLADAHAALGMVHASRLEWHDAEAELRAAVAAEPYNGVVNMWYGNLLRNLGRLRDAVPYYETARRFDPQSTIVVGNLAVAYATTGRTAEAQALIEAAQQRGMAHPTFAIAALAIGVESTDRALVQSALADWFRFFPAWLPAGSEELLAQAAFDAAARPRARQLLLDAMQDERNLGTWGTLLIGALVRDFDTAFAAADAGLPASGGSWGVALWHPGAAEWRQDARFETLAERLRMPGFWRESGWPDACRPRGPVEFECNGEDRSAK